jgi:hypothetical protein
MRTLVAVPGYPENPLPLTRYSSGKVARFMYTYEENGEIHKVIVKKSVKSLDKLPRRPFKAEDYWVKWDEEMSRCDEVPEDAFVKETAPAFPVSKSSVSI